MQNKIKKILSSLSIALLVVAFMAIFVMTTKAGSADKITVNALVFNEAGQLVSDGTYDVRIALYTVNRLKVDTYPSNKDEEERVWSIEKRAAVEDGKLKVKLEVPSVDYNRYYLGIRINKDDEMIPRKAIVLGEAILKEVEVKKVEIEEIRKKQSDTRVEEGFTKQEELNKTLIEAVQNLQAGTSPGNIPILNEDGRIDRSLLDIPTPAGTGGLSQITLNVSTESILTEITTSLLANQEFITSITNITNIEGGEEAESILTPSVTSNTPSNGNGIIYESSSDSYISTVLNLELLRDITLNSVEENDFLVYDGDNNEWVNQSLTGGDGVDITDFEVSINAGLADLTDVNNSMLLNDSDIFVYDSYTSKWTSRSLGDLRGGVASTTFTGLTDTPNTYTAGSLLFTSGSAVTQDNTNLFWDDTTNRLGIGTTTPTQLLEIAGGNIQIDNTTNTNQDGIIYKGATPFIHNFNYGDNGIVYTVGGNTFIGVNAGNLTMGNTATGGDEASYNTVIGEQAFYSNTTGSINTANGYNALHFNTTGSRNTADGYQALFMNTTGSHNTANGSFSLTMNTEGSSNTATGNFALFSNTTGSVNIATGPYSLYSNTTGISNTATGPYSLYSNTTGISNTATGPYSLYSNTTGISNTAIGRDAGAYVTDGSTGNAMGSQNVFLGANTKANADGDSNEIVIGYNAIGLGSNTMALGNTNLTVVAPTGDGVADLGGATHQWKNLYLDGTATIGDYTLPNTDGTANQVLKTNGSGALTWQADTDTGATSIDGLTDGQNDAGNNNLFLGSAGFSGTFYNEYNTATGIGALTTLNTDNAQASYGRQNTANGYSALTQNSSGYQNSAVGAFAMFLNNTGAQNTSLGAASFMSNMYGNSNVAIGYEAGLYIFDAATSNTMGSYNVFLGAETKALADGDQNEIVIGYNTIGLGSNTMALGNTALTVVAPTGDGVADLGNATHQWKNLYLDGTATIGDYTLPNTDGTSGQVLQTNGSGSLAWTSSPSGATFIGLGDTPSSYTAGSLLFTSGSEVTQDNANLFWDDTTNRLGIGTTTPTQSLEIAAGNIQIDNTTNTNQNGIIYKGATPFIHNFNYGLNGNSVTTEGGNTFVGLNSGNLTMGTIATQTNEASYNTAIGEGSFYANKTGSQNTANGYRAMYANTEGSGNIGSGYNALYSNTVGRYNTANGFQSMYSNTDGSNNIAMGYQALYFNDYGDSNIAIGDRAFYGNTDGSGNIAIGDESGRYIADGTTANSSGTSSVFIGYNTKALSSGDTNEIVIGEGAVGLGSSTMALGNTSLTLVAPTGDGVADLGNATHQWKNLYLDGTATIGDYTLPNTDGTANQVLKTNGSGALTWQADTNTGATSIDGLTDGQNDATNNNLFLGGAGFSGTFYNDFNTATGVGAFATANTDNTQSYYGDYNTANGFDSLHFNTTGYNNTASGHQALYFNTIGSDNTASGFESLYSNTTGYNNTASGNYSLQSNTTGSNNTASGFESLYSNTTASGNTASGNYSLQRNITGSDNTASGRSSLYLNTTGSDNTASGRSSLHANTTGHANTASGVYSLYSNTMGNQNTAIGYYADVTANNLINATAIGYNAKVNASNKVRIGDTNVTVIEGQVAWSNPSDERLKSNITDSDIGLSFIMDLRPTTFNYINGNTDTEHLGLIAQEVESTMDKLDVTFSGLNKPGDTNGFYSIAYSNFVMPLINAVQELKNEQDEEDSLNKLAISANTLRTDANITNLVGLQASVDSNLLLINQGLITLGTGVNTNLENITTNSEDIEINKTELASLSENVTLLTELINGTDTVDGLINTLTQHERRIAGIEAILKISPNPSSKRGETIGLTISDTLQSFSDNLQVTTEERTGESSVQIFTLSGDLIVERLKATKIEADEIEVAGIIVKNESAKNIIGEAVICPEGYYYNKIASGDDTKCQIAIDEDNDGIEDKLNTSVSNGLIVKVSTEKLSENSRVFITAKGTDSVGVNLTVIEKKSDEYFVVSLSDRQSDKDIEFDWMIIEEGE